MRKLNKSSRRKKGGYLPKNLLEQNDDDGIPTNLYISSDEEDNEPVELNNVNEINTNNSPFDKITPYEGSEYAQINF